jgi:hypothetical protein
VGKKIVEDLKAISKCMGEFTFSKEWFPLWRAWRDNFEDCYLAKDRYFKAYCERRATLLLKLSMLCNLSRGGSMVLSQPDMVRASTLMEEVERDMPLAFQGFGRMNTAALRPLVLEFLRLTGPLKDEAIWPRFQTDCIRFEYESMMKALVHAKDLVYDKETKCFSVNAEKKDFQAEAFNKRLAYIREVLGTVRQEAEKDFEAGLVENVSNDKEEVK